MPPALSAAAEKQMNHQSSGVESNGSKKIIEIASLRLDRAVLPDSRYPLVVSDITRPRR
jgi:hypothetical protein